MFQVLGINTITGSKIRLKTFQRIKINSLMYLCSPFCLEEELGLSFPGIDALLSEITSSQLRRQFANNNFNATQKYICNAE